MRASRVSSLKSQRIQASYVTRMNAPQGVEKVDALSPSKPVANSTSFHSENALLSYDEYYETLKELKGEFKRYYQDEQNLGKALKDLDAKTEEIIEQLRELIKKYNYSVESLKKLEERMGNINTDGLREILQRYEKELELLGLRNSSNLKLYMDGGSLINNIRNNEDPLINLFYPVKNIILELYKAFRNIKLPQTSVEKGNYGSTEFKGILLDDKL